DDRLPGPDLSHEHHIGAVGHGRTGSRWWTVAVACVNRHRNEQQRYKNRWRGPTHETTLHLSNQESDWFSLTKSEAGSPGNPQSAAGDRMQPPTGASGRASVFPSGAPGRNKCDPGAETAESRDTCDGVSGVS